MGHSHILHLLAIVFSIDASLAAFLVCHSGSSQHRMLHALLAGLPEKLLVSHDIAH